MSKLHRLVPVPQTDRDGELPGWESYIVGTLALMQRDIGTHSVEIGTLYGTTTANIARATNHVVYTVDIPEDATPAFSIDTKNAKYIGRTPEFPGDIKGLIVALRCDSAVLELPPELKVGFAFIDGAHTYEYCWNDFRKIKPLLVPGAVVVFHDCGIWEGVGKAVEEIMEEHNAWQWSAYYGTSLVWGKIP